jgi:hypothetical protein
MPVLTDHARELFSSLASGNRGGWREAATSKVLHMKWPRFFPVIDGERPGRRDVDVGAHGRVVRGVDPRDRGVAHRVHRVVGQRRPRGGATERARPTPQ